MENKAINIGIIAEIAEALKELKEIMVFVGGAIVSLYADNPAAEEMRPTEDVDMMIEFMNYGKWVKMQERLSELGFFPDPNGRSICRSRD